MLAGYLLSMWDISVYIVYILQFVFPFYYCTCAKGARDYCIPGKALLIAFFTFTWCFAKSLFKTLK